MTTVAPLNHDQLPGILLQDEAGALREAPGGLRGWASAGDGGPPDSDLSVLPIVPPVEPA
jgi:hypothetical protein